MDIECRVINVALSSECSAALITTIRPRLFLASIEGLKVLHEEADDYDRSVYVEEAVSNAIQLRSQQSRVVVRVERAVAKC